MTIKDWPEQDRPREKLMARGAAALTDAELLALLMVTGRRGMDVLENARLLLNEHGTLRKLLDMPQEEMQKLPGLGVALACKLQAALELAHRHLRATLDKGESLDPHAARRWRFSRPSSSTTATACWLSKNCSRARSTPPGSTPAKSPATPCCTTPPP